MDRPFRQCDGQACLEAGDGPAHPRAGATPAKAVSGHGVEWRHRARLVSKVSVDDDSRYRDLAVLSPAVVYAAASGAIGRTVSINEEIERLLGFTPAEWMAEPEPPGPTLNITRIQYRRAGRLSTGAYIFVCEDLSS